MADLSATFRKPFAEQVAAFRLRLGDLVPTARWDDIARSQHDRAFMVAGAMKADLLADLAAAVDRAVAEGTSLEEFRRDFRRIVEERGWHGWTGEGTKRGEAWRTRVIYRTNLATSYAAGRMAQLVEGNFAYWVYRHGGSREPREIHLSWNGLVLPPDHPFWRTHAPPNGWGCSCYIVGARSEAGARRVGGDPDRTLPDGWQAPDPKTGAPAGIDRGWDYAPGATAVDDIRAIVGKPVNWPYDTARAYMESLTPELRDALVRAYRALPSLAEAVRRYAEAVREGRQTPEGAPFLRTDQPRTLGLLTRADVAAVRAATGRDADGFDLSLDRSAVLHVLRRHGDPAVERTRGQRAVTAEDFALLPAVVSAPDRVTAEPAVRGQNPVLRYERIIGTQRIVALFELRTGRRRLALLTMWVEVPAGPRP